MLGSGFDRMSPFSSVYFTLPVVPRDEVINRVPNHVNVKACDYYHSSVSKSVCFIAVLYALYFAFSSG